MGDVYTPTANYRLVDPGQGYLFAALAVLPALLTALQPFDDLVIGIRALR